MPTAAIALSGRVIQKTAKIQGYEIIEDEPELFVKNPDWKVVDVDGEIPVSDLADARLKMLGVASAEYQDNGHDTFPNSSWAHWEDKQTLKWQKVIDLFHMNWVAKPISKLLKKVHINIETNNVEAKSGKALNYWDDTDKLIEHLKSLGVSHYRCSLDRSIIETEKGVFDQEAIKHYRGVYQKLFEAGIEPNVTIWHFNDPQWFMENGGWENEDNIDSYVNFVKVAMPALLRPYKINVTENGQTKEVEKRIRYCSTFNEPAAYAFCGGVLGDFPPGKFLNFASSARILKNLLMTHDKLYAELKAIDPELQVGITHNILRFRANNQLNPIMQAVCHYFTEITNRSVMRYFEEGVFSYRIPFVVNLRG